ncbi:uncharacterized protein FPRO_07169 [Fusarium proliferatum ET1]|uniref:Peptidase S1 domain-containing protein n=1 Tax=Fusarium proliferatum (strain ET1) TaxID=1227346 RepID=A0A1L7VDX8_FUSPR|nr:uncharacterized protein FPRO_07169 [Fusarium proliferatum ET1]CZR37640.1 uncharacterized protein FPRO_07169 [Fusarium proliferatum ET1]
MSSTASKPGRAAVWKLLPPASNHPAESTIIPDDGSKGSQESIIGEDQRALVDFSDLQEGGKYRSIVKIQARFEGKGKPVWMMGTGWLIRPDILVTAGHVVYDWGRHYGAATQIRCYIGYNGRASVKTAQVQVRHGVNVVTTSEWIEAANNRTRDVAFVQLDRAFTGNLRTFNFVNTPMSGHKTLLGVVGYPGDKSLRDIETGDEENGAQMYEEYAKNDYDIEASPRHMVEYSISTFGGQLMGPTRQVAGEEGIFDWLGPVLKTAVNVAKPIATQAIGSLIKGALGAESTVSEVSSEHEKATKILLQRAVMADTALQALMTMPSHKLQQLKPINADTGDTEGIFDFIKDTVQKLGPMALDTAKQAAKAYLPRLIDAASQKVSSKLGFQPETSTVTHRLSKKASLLDTLNSNSNALKVSHIDHRAAGLASIDITPMIRARQIAWVPSEEWQKGWDDNDDGPVMMKQPPPDF